ncbi:hypothetical protein E5676_scaffold976G00030 [Cucumis melo var. makuwa]|uniref:Retrovirus-related Pol polyprotein from transposon TNT 1-94 n=1 Tax=Cucumis melo var. makuwa TaxID=1194695 RepID=A0A5D3BFI9_CUCMM|nr:hypothetical protein E5676_scaffold976G00030 [Cucumis melo var. makuwa]
MDFLRQTFQTTRKGNLNMEDYLRTMKNNIDNLGQAGSLVPPRALVSQVLLGLYEVYKPVIAVIQRQSSRASVNPSPTGICNLNFLFFEKILEHQNSQCNTRNATLNAAVNVAKREEPQTTAEDVAATEATNPLAKCVSSNPFATSETIIDLNWYIDSGATNHVMAESSSLTNSVDYSAFKNILCVPDITKNLDKASGEILLKGTLKDGLYHLDNSGLMLDAEPSFFQDFELISKEL